MTTVDVYTFDDSRDWPETADAREVLEPVRQVWRDEDREVLLDDDDYRDAA